MKANAGKCASLRVVPSGKKRTMKVMTETHRYWGPSATEADREANRIPSITFKDLVKYLGVEIQPDGSVRLPRKQWETYLQNLRRSHLNPIQKIEAIRQVVVAKIQYHLRLSDHGLEEARKLNRLIRKAVKEILHLPTWTATVWIHHQNGANIPDLTTTTMISRCKATRKMKLSTDPAARATGDELAPQDEDRLARLNLINAPNMKEEHQRHLEEQLVRQNNGRAMTTMMSSKHRRTWLWTQRGLMPGNKIRLIQALSSTLPTKVNKTRGNQDRRAKICTRCKKNEVEDDGHILARCTYGKDLITKRHDYVSKKIAKELVNQHPTARVWPERSWRLNTQLLQPDITMVDGDKCYIIEITIPYENSEQYLQQRRTEKIDKYKQLINEELRQVKCTEGEMIPIVIGALGTITEECNQDLKRLKLTKHRDALQMTVATGSVNVLNNHFRRHDFDPH